MLSISCLNGNRAAKPGVEHFGHRVAMLRRALLPHPQFDLLELVDVNFSVLQTLPQLKKQFSGTQLVFLFGSDIIDGLPDWPNAERLLASSELLIGLRKHNEQPAVELAIRAWPTQPQSLTIIASYAPEVSSGRIRAALYRRQTAGGLLASVQRYSDRHWLYVSLA
ncbi:MAG TPA: hypothetical protein VK712_01145 [Verrucomicrobiae bacterium]|jgi:nicotinic acid mononucleotide adenylyltransferase|nr:hypothetical protein [Verrucomicrobiae bacterium]